MLWWNRWKLRSTNPQRRQHAAVTLAARGDRTGTDAIVGMLQSDQGNVCWTIQAVTTARVQNPVVTRVLADLLKKTTDWVTAGNIVDALQAIGDRSPYIIDALVRAMSDPILSRVCGKAEDALKRLGAAEEAGMAARRRHLESLRNLTGAEIVLRLLSSIEGKGTSVPLPVTWAEELSLADEKFTEHSAPASEVSSVCKHLLGLPSSLFFGTPWETVVPHLPHAVRSALLEDLENRITRDWMKGQDVCDWMWLEYLGWATECSFLARNRSYQIHLLRTEWSQQHAALSNLLLELPIVSTDDAMRYLIQVSQTKDTQKAHEYFLERRYDRNSSVCSDSAILYMDSPDDVLFYVLSRKYLWHGTDESNLAQNATVDRTGAVRLKIPFRWNEYDWINNGDTMVVKATHTSWFVAVRVGESAFLCGSDFSDRQKPQLALGARPRSTPAS